MWIISIISDDIESFQNGVDTIANGCTTYGSTPTTNTPSAIVTAIKNIYNNRYTTGYNSGYNAGQSAGGTITIPLLKAQAGGSQYGGAHAYLRLSLDGKYTTMTVEKIRLGWANNGAVVCTVTNVDTNTKIYNKSVKKDTTYSNVSIDVTGISILQILINSSCNSESASSEYSQMTNIVIS